MNGSHPPPYQPIDIYNEQLQAKPMILATAPGQYSGPYQWWIPPSQFSREVTRNIVNQITKGGVLRQSWGIAAIQYVMTGWPGNSGMTGLLDSQIGMGVFSPDFGVDDQLYFLTYPWYRLMDIPVYVDYFKLSADVGQMPNYASYEIHLSQVSTSKSAAPVYTTISTGVNAPAPVVPSSTGPTPPGIGAALGGS